MIYCLLLSILVSLTERSWSQATMTRDGKSNCPVQILLAGCEYKHSS